MARRQKLLDWIKYGSCDAVPVMFSNHKDIAASFLGVKPNELTGMQAEKEAEKMGIEGVNNLGCVTLLDMVPYCPDIEMEERKERLADGTERTFRTMKTPMGALSDIRDKPLTWEAAPRECFVKTEGDLPAFEFFVRSAVRAAIEDPRARNDTLALGLAAKKEMSDDTVAVWGMWTPLFELTCTNYFMADTAIYLLYDHQMLFEELMELLWEKDKAFHFPTGYMLGADIFMTAINGLEWYSPEHYERYHIPQGERFIRWAKDKGILSWIHTCGRMNTLINSGAYDRLRPDILESLSSPPPGDIMDMAAARKRLGRGITTRGGINVEIIYNGSPDEVRKETARVLDGTRGYRHMIGDTNGHFYGDPPENIKAVIDVVRERGMSFT